MELVLSSVRMSVLGIVHVTVLSGCGLCGRGHLNREAVIGLANERHSIAHPLATRATVERVPKLREGVNREAVIGLAKDRHSTAQLGGRVTSLTSHEIAQTSTCICIYNIYIYIDIDM